MTCKIDKALIEKILKEPITEFSVKPGSNFGDNVAGCLLSINVKTAAGKELDLVYKYMSDDPMQAKYAEDFGIFRTEMAIYNNLTSDIEKLVKKRGINAALPVPKLYEGFCGGTNDFICMEDVRPQGYIMPNKYLGLNFPEVSLIMKEIARFHAYSHFLIKYEGEKYFEGEKVNSLVSNPWAKSDPVVMQTGKLMFGGCLQNAVTLMKRNNPELVEKLEPLSSDLNSIIPILQRMQLNLDKKWFPTVIHGDLWVNNIMIKYEDNNREKPMQLKFIDFQMSRRGSIFDDLQYFIMTSTTPDFRQKHLSQVLTIYYDSFCSFIQELNCPPPQNFTKGFFIDSFEECRLFGYIYMTFAIPLQLAEPLDFAAIAAEAAAKAAAAGSGDENSPAESGQPNSFPPVDAVGPGGAPNALDGLSEDDKNIIMRNMLLLHQMEKSPKALERLEAITRELVALNIL